jgi:hypothetical protein
MGQSLCKNQATPDHSGTLDRERCGMSAFDIANSAFWTAESDPILRGADEALPPPLPRPPLSPRTTTPQWPPATRPPPISVQYVATRPTRSIIVDATLKPKPAWRVAANARAPVCAPEAAAGAVTSQAPAAALGGASVGHAEVHALAAAGRPYGAHADDWVGASSEPLAWLLKVTGALLPDGAALPLNKAEAHALLKSGVVLCDLVNVLRPGAVRDIERLVSSPFPQREHIARFLAAAAALGVHGHETFQTEDLFGGQGIRQVIVCIAALGRLSHGLADYAGPTLGKPDRARLGAHRTSKHAVAVGEGRWGTAAGQYRPDAGPAESAAKQPSAAAATGMPSRRLSATPAA